MNMEIVIKKEMEDIIELRPRNLLMDFMYHPRFIN